MKKLTTVSLFFSLLHQAEKNALQTRGWEWLPETTVSKKSEVWHAVHPRFSYLPGIGRSVTETCPLGGLELTQLQENGDPRSTHSSGQPFWWGHWVKGPSHFSSFFFFKGQEKISSKQNLTFPSHRPPVSLHTDHQCQLFGVCPRRLCI